MRMHRGLGDDRMDRRRADRCATARSMHNRRSARSRWLSARFDAQQRASHCAQRGVHGERGPACANQETAETADDRLRRDPLLRDRADRVRR